MPTTYDTRYGLPKIAGATNIGGLPRLQHWNDQQPAPLNPALGNGWNPSMNVSALPMPGMMPPLPPPIHMGDNGNGRIAMPGGGGGMGGWRGFGGRHPDPNNPTGHISGGIASKSYTQRNDALPIPPGYAPAPGNAPPSQKQSTPLPGAPPGTNPLPQGLPGMAGPAGFMQGAMQGINMPPSPSGTQQLSNGDNWDWNAGAPVPAWTGGHFQPGQSAIVGDKPNGDPGPNAEIVTAMPGGGFTVTPNPKNMPKLPRFANGTPPGMAFGTPMPNINVPPGFDAMLAPSPAEAKAPNWHPYYQPAPDGMTLAGGERGPQPTPQAMEYERGLQETIRKNKPLTLGGIGDSIRGGIGSAIHGADEYATTAIRNVVNPITRAIFGDESASREAQSKLAEYRRTGSIPQPLRPPPDQVNGLPLSPGDSTWHVEPEWDTPDNEVSGLPGGGDSGHAEPEMDIKQPEAAWLPHQLNAYALAQATNEKWHQAEGQKGWIDPTKAAMQAGANPPASQPSEFAAPDPSIARANNILQGWRNPPPAQGMPEGLNPVEQAAYTDRQQRLSGTRAGQQQLLQEKLMQTGQLPLQQGQQAMSRQDYDYRHGPHTYNTAAGEMTFINGQRVEGAKARDLTPEELHKMGLTASKYKDSNGLQYGPIAHTSTGALARPLLGQNGEQTGHYVTVDSEGKIIGSAFKGPKGEIQPGLHELEGTGIHQLIGKDGKTISLFRQTESGLEPYDPKAKPEPKFKPGAPHNFGGMDEKTGMKVDDWRERDETGKWVKVDLSEAPAVPQGVIIKRKS